jgi:hypothetical protein
MVKRRSIITIVNGVKIDPKKGIGQVRKLAKPRKKKVWVNFQAPIELRDEASKAAIMLNINISKYLRKKLVDLVNAAKLGRVPKVTDEFVPKATVDTNLDRQV